VEEALKTEMMQKKIETGEYKPEDVKFLI